MKALTMLDTIRVLLGVPACAIPLSLCKPAKSYLLERAGIPQTGTAILFAVPYVMTADVHDPSRKLSLYAVPRDYHGYMKEQETVLLPYLRETYPHHSFSLFSDHSPILEVDAAARAGLGVLGRNGLLLTSDYGSLVFLGEILTDADYTAVTGDPMPPFPQDPPTCHGCGACQRACPVELCTERCLSALTQKKGELSAEEQAALLAHGCAWGCDRCQEVCPVTLQAKKAGTLYTRIPFFKETALPHVTADLLRHMEDGDFAARAYSWRGRNVILRNLEILERGEGS